MLDDGLVGAGTGDDAVKAFVAGIEPLVEHFCLEQRSREVREEKSRIRFAREEPAAQERQPISFLRSGRSRAARNLRPFQAKRRDVL